MKKLILILAAMALLISCSEKKDTLEINTHPKVWNEKASEDFHGKSVLASGAESCKSCHGANYGGGTSGIACADCHKLFPHAVGFADLSSPDFHGEYLKTEINWDIAQCETCHGVDYSGGSSGSSCLDCHTGVGGPRSCNTCHGNEVNPAPPQALDNATQISAPGVGVHQAHLVGMVVANNYTCNACHAALVGYDDPNHIDDTPNAEVVFSALATDNGRLQTAYDKTTGTCSNVYCHGSFEFATAGDPIIGNQNPVKWNDPAITANQCDFCHGLPPVGHFGQGTLNTPQSCASCHGSVVNPDGTIKNKTKHINGEKNFN